MEGFNLHTCQRRQQQQQQPNATIWGLIRQGHCCGARPAQRTSAAASLRAWDAAGAQKGDGGSRVDVWDATVGQAAAHPVEHLRRWAQGGKQGRAALLRRQYTSVVSQQDLVSKGAQKKCVLDQDHTSLSHKQPANSPLVKRPLAWQWQQRGQEACACVCAPGRPRAAKLNPGEGGTHFQFPSEKAWPRRCCRRVVGPPGRRPASVGGCPQTSEQHLLKLNWRMSVAAHDGACCCRAESPPPAK